MANTTLDNIRTLCAKRGMTIASLERELGFSNGSLAKPSVLPSDRLYKIAKYFGVTMDCIYEDEKPLTLSDVYRSLSADDQKAFRDYALYLYAKR